MRKRYNKNTPRKRRTKKGTIRGRSKRSKRTNKKRLSKRNRRQRGGGSEEINVLLSEGNKKVKCRVLKIIDTTQDPAAEKKGVTLDFFAESDHLKPRTSIPLSQVSNCTLLPDAELGPSVEVTGVYSDTKPHPDLTITPVTSCERAKKSFGVRWGDDTVTIPADQDDAKKLSALIQDKKEFAKVADRNALLGAEGSAKAPWATAPGRQHM